MRKELSVCLFLLGLVLFNAPFLQIFDGVFLYLLFAVWVPLIVVLAPMARESRKTD